MGTLFLTKEARIYNGAKITSSISGTYCTLIVHIGTTMCKRMKLEYFLMPYKDKLKMD